MKNQQSQPLDVKAVIAVERPARRRGRWIVIGLLLLTALAAALLLRDDEQKNKTNYLSSIVQRGDLTVTVTATGTLAPLNQVDVGSEVSGTMETVAADFNQRIKRGQVLAQLNTDEQQARVVQARAALEVAEARVQQAAATLLEARLKLQRCESLAAKNLCPPQDLDTAKASHARAQADETSARAQVSQARATLDAEQTRLKKAVIRSPIDGIVLKRQIEPGQTVAASLQAPVLFTLAENLAQMELRVAVDEADVGKVREGQQAQFTVDAYPNRLFGAKISQVRLAPQTTGGVVSYETILSVDNSDLALRPGMTATAEIVVHQVQDALLVANAALRFSPPPQTAAAADEGFMDKLFPRMGKRPASERGNNDKGRQQQLWIERNGTLEAIPVRSGASDGKQSEIVEGAIEAGQAVVIDIASPPR